MTDPMVDQMTRLKLRLQEKRLEKERETVEGRAESGLSTRSFDSQLDALHTALRQKQDLLQRLREQHRLEDQSRPHTWGGTFRSYRPDRLHPLAPLACPPAPIYTHQPALLSPRVLRPAPAAPPQPPHLIQQTWPQPSPTIIQQFPAQQPLTQQIPRHQPNPAPRSGSIKEDMVELMLMQNAQMHQIIMHNMMLNAIPPMAQSPPHPGQVEQRGNTIHHHHYGPHAYPLPPIGYSTWPSMRSSLPAGQGDAHVQPVQHVTSTTTSPPLNIE
ncbi:hypothetical protein DPEC_G00151140 [Dallia pectoralis]|uniref:Uncharacterized protein n=1 Tax=Dallia pectoralis TaxID=75939 RepID=A0ACC2GJS2_DALPE|nr:hypothetical protein DPEC_G00151140 [Dallia pectoralis]